MGIHTHGLLQRVEVGNCSNVLTDGAPGQPGSIKGDGRVHLSATPSKQVVNNLLLKEEEDLVLSDVSASQYCFCVQKS